jgi:hypothetical protein
MVHADYTDWADEESHERTRTARKTKTAEIRVIRVIRDELGSENIKNSKTTWKPLNTKPKWQ